MNFIDDVIIGSWSGLRTYEGSTNKKSFNLIIFNILTQSFNLNYLSAFSNYYTYNDRILLKTKK